MTAGLGLGHGRPAMSFSPSPVVSPQVEVRRHTRAAPWTYAGLDQRQREVADRVRRDSDAPGALLLSEVAPVITLGRRTVPADLLMDEAAYRERGIELLAVDRGGLATWHGPGQWVAFAVDRLDRLTGDSRGVRRAVEGLLEAAAGVARRYAPSVDLRWGAETGLWLPGSGKLASVGVHVERGVLLHGLSLNVQRHPGSFLGLRACGLDAQPAFLVGDVGLGTDCGRAFEKVGVELQEALLERFWRASHSGRLRDGE